MVEYVGLDVSKEETCFCVKDEAGMILALGKVASDPEAIFEALRELCHCPGRIVVETGTQSGWLVRELRGRGLAVDLIDARQAHAVMKLQHNKTDAKDAALLAEIARTGFCRPVAVKSEAAQRYRILLKSRAHVVDQRRRVENTIRGLLGSVGLRFPKGVAKFAERVRRALEAQPDLGAAVLPLLSVRASLERSIERLDREVGQCAKDNPACRLLMSVPGVGAVTALAFVATIEDPRRFSTSRAVGAYLGLTSRRYQSGEMDYSGRISKHGDAMLRSLLYGAANSLLTLVHRAHPLKDWARGVKRRTSHKKACVALARKLAVILHRMLMTGEAFRWPPRSN
ncbi:MAG: IS110 family transposase [Gammaproteobacteria bacterium]|nr:IS110 family transposase [Gammaproteobacteria bacterium]